MTKAEKKVSPSAAQQQAEKRRLQGNDAFGTKDWERALELYRESVELLETPKAYSNLAATLCKLSLYQEASGAAERATLLEPQWAKGWWRRGVVSELLKDFALAYRYYSIAADLEPKEKSFQLAQKNARKRLDCTEQDDDGNLVVNSFNFVQAPQDAPQIVAWRRFRVDNPEQKLDVYIPRQSNFPKGDNPTSEQYLNHGLAIWSTGLKDSVAHLQCVMKPQLHQQATALLQQGRERYGSNALKMMDTPLRNLLGGNPFALSIQHLSNAYAHLGGTGIVLQNGGGGAAQMADSLCPQPAALPFMVPYQMVGVLNSVRSAFQDVLAIFGPGMKVLGGVLMAVEAVEANLRMPKITGGQAGKPQEVVDYIKRELKSGRTWDGGLRKLVSVSYRGSILFGGTIRLHGQVAPCYEIEKAAREFIDLADKEFKVTEEGTYDEKGSTFRESFRIGMAVSELKSLVALQMGSNTLQPGPFCLKNSMDLCMYIIDMGKSVEIARTPGKPDYCFVQDDVAFRRKPLAIAHSTLAKQLLDFHAFICEEEWDAMTIHYKFRDSLEEKKSPNAVVAEQYRCAAEAELHDASQQAVFWWTHACLVARSTPKTCNDADIDETSLHTLGDLRYAVAKGTQAECDRDVELFGPNEVRGSADELASKHVLNFFHDKPDSFRLPCIEMVENGNVISLKTSDTTICTNLEEAQEYTLDEQQRRLATAMDTTEVEKKHGTEIQRGVPPLSLLCVRQLHKQACEFAAGETDGAIIQYKAISAGWKGRE